jgi:uncharacterized protein
MVIRAPNMRFSFRAAIIFVFCMTPAGPFLGQSPAATEPAKVSVLMASGMPGSASYHVGLGMASLWTTRLRSSGVRVSAAASEGSIENIEAIRIADADVIISENLFATMAHQGSGLFKGKAVSELRSICNLWPNLIHVIVRSDKAGSLEDLENKAVGIELPDSGVKFVVENSIKQLKSHVNWRPMAYLAAGESLRRGQIQGLVLLGGLPVPLAVSLFNDRSVPLSLLEVKPGDQQASDTELRKSLESGTIPANTYSGQEKPVHSFGLMSGLYTTSALNPQVVYSLTKIIFENLDYLSKIHPACKSISPEKALEGLEVPLHRGAVKYFRERKIKIPERLIQ